MSEYSAPDVPVPPPASPYGPAEGVVGTSAPEPAARQADPVWVDRGRRILRVAIWSTAGLSALLVVVLVVLAAMGLGTADNDLAEGEDTLVWIAVIASPVLFVIALNLLVWRGLLRGLARKTRAQMITLVVIIGLSLSVASILAVTLLLALGFLVAAIGSAGSGFGA